MRDVLSLQDEDVFYICSGNEVLPEKLSTEEEQNLAEKLKFGDEEAKTELIERNLMLVVYTAQKFENTGVPTEDLISIGTIGLIKAVSSFSIEKNIKMATYASRCIENEILMHYRTNKKNNKTISLNMPVGFDKDGNEITLVDVLKIPDKDYGNEIQKNEDIKLLKKYFN